MSVKQVVFWALVVFLAGVALGRGAFEYGRWSYLQTHAEEVAASDS